MGLLVVPESWSIPYLEAENNARRFLEVLWQVDAAALALAVALVAVALQVFSVRTAGSLQESVRETGLLPVVFVGTAALLVNGVLLVELVREPVGGPATWAALVSAIGLLLIPILYSRAALAIDPTGLLKTRAERASREAQLSVAQDLFDRIAYALLRELCEASPIQLQFGTPRVPSSWTFIRSTRAGTVRNVNVYRLARLARLSMELTGKGRDGQLILGVHVGQRVGVGTPMLALSPDFSESDRRVASRVIRL